MLLKWSSFRQVLPSLQRTSEALLEWLLGSWSSPWPRPLLPGYTGRMANSRKNPGGYKLLPFYNYWGHSDPGNTQRFRNGFIPLSWSMPRHKSMRVSFWIISLVFVLTCSLNGGTLYTQVCAFLNYVQSIKFATGGLKVLDTFLGWWKQTDHNSECHSKGSGCLYKWEISKCF